MSYTSPSPSLVSANGQQTTWWIPATNFGTQVGSGVNITITFSPAASLQLVTYTAPTGTSFSPNTGIWNVGTLAPGANNTKWLKIVTSVADIGMAPFTLTSVISGNGIDPNNVNNTKVQTLNNTVENAVAGAINDLDACNCIDVSVNDTPCSHGTTEWRITPGSVTNSTTYTFDETTGQGRFTYLDPTEEITFTYSIWCDVGTGFVQTSGPATVTIGKLIENLSPFNHTIAAPVPYSSLCPQEITVLLSQYPTLDLSKYCWRILKNGDGDATSGEPVDCNEDTDGRVFFLCSDLPCTTPEDPCPCPTDELPVDVPTQFPVGYAPEKGDTVVIYHTNATSIWTYDGFLWNKWSCGCIYKISQDLGNALSLGSDNAPFLSIQSIQGPQGSNGVQGPIGAQGIAGSFAAQGIQGATGPTGAVGPQGIQGVPGEATLQGAQGTQGIQGFRGSQGIQGTQSIQGIQGIQGPAAGLTCCCWASINTESSGAGLWSYGKLHAFLEGCSGEITLTWQHYPPDTTDPFVSWTNVATGVMEYDTNLGAGEGYYRLAITKAGCCATYSNVYEIISA